MTTRATARHRAEVTTTNSIAVLAKTVGGNAGVFGRQAAVIAAASGLVLTSGLAANAADANVKRESAPLSGVEVGSTVATPISAASTIAITFEKPAVTTTPAPVVEPEPVVEVQEAEPVAAAAPAAAVTAAPAVAAATAKVTTKAAAPAAQAPASNKGAAILSAAYAQLGVVQDCTMLVTNSLAAVGINFHDWPAGYLGLGRTVSAAEAQPGDLIYYANGGSGMAHIAVYAGNGQAVHGGFNGNQTIVFSANVGSGPVFIRVN
ncbi:Peptidoglycan endopeptidase RipA precursor [Arthrobacter ulcerisalmonis]|uniref:Peptidoglycan endopeptidase RipA n=1 Tax=Arthrobacter ulcerisalmonis TaxID=2483813 RepID=A0A3P5X8T3_9MICC|nr:NlpC/P60 family protein [Arthrobacter ulcerisalmonis]VDC23804.1 Peptidoglycan endopeptidase RipA precursor [Arthrobacter ulcerisalmonis]